MSILSIKVETFHDCMQNLQGLSNIAKINRIYDGVEAKTRKSQASFQII